MIKNNLCCIIDSIEGGLVKGWAHDPAAPNSSLKAIIVLDGQEIQRITCDESRPDVSAAGFPHALVGFTISVPGRFRDGETHYFEMMTEGGISVPLLWNNVLNASVSFQMSWVPEFRSSIDGYQRGAFRGWILENTAEDPKQFVGNSQLRVECEGQTVALLRANRYRSDVGRALSADPRCGFEYRPVFPVAKPFSQTFRFFKMPENIELDGSPYVTSILTDKQEASIVEISDMVANLHRQLTALRTQIEDLLPTYRYNIDDYDTWARKYTKALNDSSMIRLDSRRKTAPLVSIICPVYKPRLSDFALAVESVIAQTYQNWELILIDDCSGEADLKDMLQQFAQADSRIQHLATRKNSGISEASNLGLKAANGNWIAFLDHDDLLEASALDIMIAAAEATGAKLLYSDEDKIDDSGFFRDPAFKPDWNYRLLLEVNYICHFVLVQRDVINSAGPFNKQFDGAQDHDMLLRIAERLEPSEVFHVPEILYHWRITPGSTAGDIGAKPYAIEAGLQCVSRHLERRGLKADVSTRYGMTLYKIDWKTNNSPSVSIVIPFKDQIDVTLNCIKNIIEKTHYTNYQIVLVDNWSTDPNISLLQDYVSAHSNIKIIRQEIPFNYSLLNNIACASYPADYYVFLNNDLFVLTSDWLYRLVAEAEVDPRVGAVGGKFVYPNGTIQHGGVILGIGGVAGHVHTGLPGDEGGYGGRANFTQEMSAVTAAGMLVRGKAFHEIGCFDEAKLAVAFNDIDLCLRLRAAGYTIIYTPEFFAEHHESLSRGDDVRPAQERRFFKETQIMLERWGEVLRHDPFFNPHFSTSMQPFHALNDPEPVIWHWLESISARDIMKRRSVLSDYSKIVINI
ncbi:Glycosyltransferase [Granulibacter bethesdensis]|uniref:Glycosyltransferase n=1 Tax=Granulibacter bethesdensis TaxID=364410 RepID=A0AAN0RFX6_9PROT|nr:glycosyltransferase family 2 protein [Granulibacter bethesdensis]AHJ64049.1 Glycosyltransferase [Granulibacter bethesdensis]